MRGKQNGSRIYATPVLMATFRSELGGVPVMPRATSAPRSRRLLLGGLPATRARCQAKAREARGEQEECCRFRCGRRRDRNVGLDRSRVWVAAIRGWSLD